MHPFETRHHRNMEAADIKRQQDQEHYFRLLGARDGLASAFIEVGNLKGRITGPGDCYLPPKRHVRKLAAAKSRIAELETAHNAIRRKLDDVRNALAKLPEPK